MKIARVAGALGLVIGLGLTLAGCGSDDGLDARSASASASGSGTGSGLGAGECSPVGTDLQADADATVGVALDEYRFDPDAIEVAAGTVTFEAANVGQEDHELAFLPGGGEVPLTADGDPDEDALADAGAFELEAFGPDQTCDATYELDAGTYTMFCVVETPEGRTHASLGMVGELTVG